MSVTGPLERALLLVEVAIFSLGVAALMAFLSHVVGGVVTVGGGVVGAAVTWFCQRRAARAVQATWRFRLWRYAPPLLFVAFPVVYSLWIDDADASIIDLIFEYIDPLLTFVVPMICLALADWQLRVQLARNTRDEPSRSIQAPDPDIHG